jgi:hypothetical protein
VPRAVHVGFVMDEVALGLAFLPVLRFSPVSIVPLGSTFTLSIALVYKVGSAWRGNKYVYWGYAVFIFTDRGSTSSKSLETTALKG